MGSIVGLTLISDISNISRVFISNLVGDNLGSTIRKIYTIFAISSITITVFMLFKVGTRVVIKDSITILVVGRGFISRLLVRISMVSRLVGRSWVVNRSWMINWSRGVVDRGRFVDRSRVVNRSRLVNRGWVVNRGRGVVIVMMTAMKVTMRTAMEVTMGTTMEVITEMTMGTCMKSMSRGMDRDMAGGVVGSNVFLLILVLVYLIRGSSGLTVHNCMGVSTGFVD